MLIDCNLASFIHLEHLNSQEFLELTGTHESEEPWSLSFINFNGKYSCEYYKKMVLKQKKSNSQTQQEWYQKCTVQRETFKMVEE